MNSFKHMGNDNFRERFRFFHGMNGCVQRHAIAATELARAERHLNNCGWYAEWSDEIDPDGGPRDWGWSEADTKRWDRSSHECLSCVVRAECGCVLASLGCIWDADRDYMRLTEAELALEAMAHPFCCGAIEAAEDQAAEDEATYQQEIRL